MEKLDVIASIYQHSELPVAVVGSDLSVLWANQSATKRYPSLSLPDGLILMLPSQFTDRLKKIPAGQLPAVTIPLPLSGVAVVLTPASGGFVVNFTHMENKGSALRPDGSELMLSTISNQLRAPLSSIFANVSSIYQNPEACEVERLPEQLVSINQNCYLLLRSTIDLTNYLRYSVSSDEFKPCMVNLRELLSNLCNAAGVVTGSIGIPLYSDVPNEDVFISGEPEKITQAFAHIFSNSCRFTDEGNRIDVVMRVSGSRVVITISDRGLGIPSDVVERVFEPFFSHDHNGRPFSGGGLGLTLTRYIVAQHSGTVALTSVAGEGTVVAITLPLNGQSDLELRSPPRVADILRDRFSPLHVILSDSCGCPTP